VDLERRRAIDLLPDREGITVENWLKANPGVEIATRDRSATYSEVIRKGTPSANQVTDRWRLLTNLTGAVERALNNRQPHVRQAASMVIKSQTSLASAVINAGSMTMLSSRSERESEQNREKRYTRYLQVIKLRKQGLAMHVIARWLKLSQMTVRRYIEADGFPERAPTRTRHSQLEKYAPYLHRRFAAWCNNATIKDNFISATIAARLETGPLGSHLELLATALQNGDYATSTIATHLRHAHAFGCWLSEKHQLDEISELMLERYLSDLSS